jgi:excisionase family DNA binding protein
MTDHDVAGTARLLGVTERTVRRWLRDGRLVGYKVGGRVRIPDSAVREAATPYGTGPAAPPDLGDPLLTYLSDPARREEVRRRRIEWAVRTMDEIRARSKPPTGPDDTAEALVRQVRDEQDARWDDRLDLDRS